MSSESSQSNAHTSELQNSTCSSPNDTETDSDSTRDDMQSIASQTSIASDRSLRLRIPISYNETLLQCLHGRPQVKTLNNLSIPLPDSSDEDTEDTDETTQEEKCKESDTMSKWTITHDIVTASLYAFKPIVVVKLYVKEKINYFKTIATVNSTAILNVSIKLNYFRTLHVIMLKFNYFRTTVHCKC